jgi:hypothetical protein
MDTEPTLQPLPRSVYEYPWQALSANSWVLLVAVALYFVAGWRAAIRHLRSTGQLRDPNPDPHRRLVQARHEHQQAASALSDHEKGLH